MTGPSRFLSARSSLGAYVLGRSIFATAILLSVFACDLLRARDLERHEFSLARMGTVFRIVLYHSDQALASKAAMAAFTRVERLEQILSDFREDSEVRRLCREGAGRPLPVSPELYFLLDKSLEFSRLTGGAFDVTIGPVTRLWRESRRAGEPPDPGELARARELTGYQNVILDRDKQAVHLLLAGMRLDFGAIAKGYAADEALRILGAHGIRRALVDAGGDISLGDPPPGETGWRVAVRTGDAAPATNASLMLRNQAVATSGDAYQFFQKGGVRYSHIIEPAGGAAVKNSPSVTAIAPDGATADALATALSILGVEDGLRLADSIRGASAAIRLANGSDIELFVSSRFPKAKAPPKQSARTSPAQRERGR